jgi:class 3 adenylate cyclase
MDEREILIDGKVPSAIEAVAETQPAGELTLKGLHHPIAAFNVCGVVLVDAEAVDQPVT